MGFFSEDMMPMLGIYEAETSELMDGFADVISRVEQEGSFTADDIAELFRCSHTTKGSSAMMGLDGLATLTHRVEDLFDILRGDPSLAEGHVADILDHLFDFTDFVKDELGRMGDDDFAPADASKLVDLISRDIDALVGGTSASDVDKTRNGEYTEEYDGSNDAQDAAASGGENESAATASEAGAPRDDAGDDASDDVRPSTVDGITLKVSFKSGIPMLNARALVVLKQLKARVNVLESLPEDLSSADAAQTIADEGLLITLAREGVEDAKAFLAKSSFIRRIGVLDDAASTAKKVEAGSADAKTDAKQATSDKFVTLKWENVQSLQEMASEFLLELSRLRSAAADAPDGSPLRRTVSRTGRLVDELVYSINAMAMVSVSALVPQFSRMVREMCKQTGKKVSFKVHGGNIEIDRNLYNSISDPLLHIIRNAVDHGIETPEERLAAGKEARGNVELIVENLGSRVAFKVADDGRGMDPKDLLAKGERMGILEKPADQYSDAEAYQLIMKPGFTTTHEITQYSGRGVGMDVVSTVMRDFDGRAEVDSQLGKGTSIELFMPVSVTAVETLGFRVGPYICHLPLTNLDKIYSIDDIDEEVIEYEGSTMFTYRKHDIPVLDMHRLYACEGERNFYIVCHSMENEFAICVDEIVGQFSSSIKPLPSCLDFEWQTSCCMRNGILKEDGMINLVLNAPLLSSMAHDLDVVDASNPRKDKLTDDSAFGTGSEAVPERVFLFEIGEDRVAFPVEWVDHVMAMPECMPVPHPMPDLIGLASYRSRIVPVFDLTGSYGKAVYMLIVTNEAGEEFGLAVTSALGVFNTDGYEALEEQPPMKTYTAGVGSVLAFKITPKGEPMLLLDRR